MFDSYNRRISYLRVSVTDRCNLRCDYCMPAERARWLDRSQILTFDEIRNVAREAAALGLSKVRLTGGEPLLRRGIVTLVAMLSEISGICDLSMTTNGVLLERSAQALAEAGLNRVNVSLDALDPARYAAITHGGDVRRVLAGIAAADRAELTPVRLNCVVRQSPNEPDAQDVARFAHEHNIEARFIRRMDLDAGEFFPVFGGDGGACERCNRLRLTSDGMIRPCLFSDLAFSVRELGAREALLRAIQEKPECGAASRGEFNRIGG